MPQGADQLALGCIAAGEYFADVAYRAARDTGFCQLAQPVIGRLAFQGRANQGDELPAVGEAILIA